MEPTPVYCVKCAGVAFRVRRAPDEAIEDVFLNAATVVYDDGRTVIDDDGPTTGTLLTCQACGASVGFALTPVVAET